VGDLVGVFVGDLVGALVVGAKVGALVGALVGGEVGAAGAFFATVVFGVAVGPSFAAGAFGPTGAVPAGSM